MAALHLPFPNTIMLMQLLASWTIDHGGTGRTIQLLQGDLARLSADHSVDILVVSAFANDYLPTPSSLIGALDRVGLSVAALAVRATDSRYEGAVLVSWSSSPITGPLCFQASITLH